MITNPGIYVCGIDTDIGKTLASALLAKLFDADYWKPIQCGDLDNTDRMMVQSLLGANYKGTVHSERYALKLPQSVHHAAEYENLDIQLEDFTLPKSSRPIVVEAAGGCLVPINEKHTVLDLALQLNLPIVLVTEFYLGAYNHTLLSIEAILRRGVKLEGLILNGEDNPRFRDFISQKTQVKFLGILPRLEALNSQSLETVVQQWRKTSL